tara:strand:+ start:215 stop:691 length:477 start_codon:yes stop_codon:yes gene_type:complete
MEYYRIQAHQTILVLNASYEPLNFTNWKRAVILLLKEKAQFLSSRVIRLVNYIKLPFLKIMSHKPTRSMIYERDENTCQYCGAKKRLTIDHVIPRCHGGEDTWENLVVACSSCNTKKGSIPLEQTGMKLTKKPRPMPNKVIRKLNTTDVDEWKDYSFT